MPDAIVIGAGPNGLVAANVLTDAGWTVTVLEAQREPGGAVRTAEVTLPGFRHDLFSAFYPLATLSPALRALQLEHFGLEWARAPVALANPTPDGRCATISTDIAATAASLDEYSMGDGDAWVRLYEIWKRLGQDLVDALLSPFPPIVAASRLMAGMGRQAPELARMALLPVRRLAAEEFRGEGAAVLLGGLAAHTDLSPSASAGSIFALVLAGAGQSSGFPTPRGGAGNLTAALVRRLESGGGELQCGAEVTKVVVRNGRAVAVQTAGGDELEATRAVVADVGAPALYQDLVGEEHLSRRLIDGLRRFEYDHSTFKMDWALSAPVPWEAEAARRAGTVHVADDLDGLSRLSYELETGTLPSRPFVLFGQQAGADPSRAPAGQATGWGYVHVPQHVRRDAAGNLTGKWDSAEKQAFADRIEQRIEELAPGFRDLVRARHIMSPVDLEAHDANLVGGAVNGGTAQLHQQLVFRPVPGLRRASTGIAGLFLASASAHPGGGVHGACGANAARAALASDRLATRFVAGLGLPRRAAASPRSGP